ncbi:MAG: Na+/H+ antiporter subunit E [Thiobacillaceae bacterium]|nr:Na+/H+ antiporter subunit E [Thiobacillaceae bacterium]MDW8322935.1 Na+/H+ antiporter subunit E [Burkholderiales bacterium]
MRALLPHPLLTPILAAVWLLLNNSFSLGHILLGLLLGWFIPWFTLRFWPQRVCIRRPLILLRFIVVLLSDIVLANLAVARRILGRPAQLRPAFVIVPLSLETDLAISLLANTICLTPGTVSACLSPDRRTLLVHALHAPDTDTLVATIKARYEAPLKEVFESC